MTTETTPDRDLFAEEWRELYRLREAVKGPDGYATWQDAATAERVLRVRAERQRDEADRRAGAAERELASYQPELSTFHKVRATMKDQWGVSRNLSFDTVWAEALEYKRQARHLVDDLVIETQDADGGVTFTAKSGLLFSNMVAAIRRIGA